MNEPFDREYSTLFKKFLSKKEYYNKISRDRTLNRIVVTFMIIRVKILFRAYFFKKFVLFLQKKKKDTPQPLPHTRLTVVAHNLGSLLYYLKFTEISYVILLR